MSTYTSHHVREGTEPPTPRIFTYTGRSPIAAVDIDGGAISIAATDPQHLREIAAAFATAAGLLTAQINDGAKINHDAELTA